MTLFQTALLAAVLVGLLCGLVGCLVVLRRRAFFTVALTHATFPGGVMAAVLGVNIVVGAGAMGVGLVALMVALSRIHRQGKQVASGIVLSFGYALGVFLHALNPQLPVKVESYLTGSILAIPPENIAIIGVVLLIALLAVALWWKELLFSSFDRGGFVASGYREWRTEVLVLLLITLTVVATMPAIGSILAISMIAAPAAAARLLTQRIERLVPLACALGVGSAVLGLYVSRWFNLAAGGAMAITATVIFLLAWGWNAARASIPARTKIARG
ncbi:metal ABC transporter permease [Gulosibacter hominis]|uniref:metal ABC transporter permease n=1 Tax=Gulosibacter hominis TaxID=2770504 RepID=UPI0019193E02|nr:metal ABC transporter permease [Gulosibacter hominis]